MKLRRGGKFVKYLVKLLKRERVRNVQFGKDWISLEYDEEKIRDKITIRKHEPHVGTWIKVKDKVCIDDDLKRKVDFKAVALHEAIEKFVAQKYGLSDDFEAHDIANAKEREWLERADGPWVDHQRRVDKVWRKEGKK